MVNQDTSESLLDKLILQIFEEQEDAFSFPLTTMKETRDFVRLLNRQGFTYEMICAEIDEKFEAFRNWRLGGGPDTIGRRTMIRINKPLQEAMLSDGEDEEEETVRNGTTGDKASGGGARRKKSMDGGARARRSSKADSVDGEKRKLKEETSAEEDGTKTMDSEKKGEVEGQSSLEPGKKGGGGNKVTACDNHSKPSSPNDMSENVKEKREGTEKSNAAVATANEATPKNIKTNNDQLSKAGNENVMESSKRPSKEDIVVQPIRKDASKELETSADLKKNEHKAETGKKELATNTETNRKEEETRAVTDQKELERKVAKKPNTTTEESPKSPGSEKLDPKDKSESKKKDSKAEQKEERTEKKTNEGEGIDKTSPVSIKTPPTTKIPSKLSGATPVKSPENIARDQVTTGSTPISPISPSPKSGRPASGCREIPEEVQRPSDQTTDAPSSKTNSENAHKTISPPTTSTDPAGKAEAPPPRSNKKSDLAKSDEKNAALNNSTHNGQRDNRLETKILPDGSKISSAGKTDGSIHKSPPTERAVPLTLTTADTVRTKSEIVHSKSDDETQKTAQSLARTLSDNTNILRPSATPVSPKTDLEATKGPPSEATKGPPSEAAKGPPSEATKGPPSEAAKGPLSSEATQPTVDESYDSDLDSETKDHPAEDRALIARLHSLKQNQTRDGPGHLFVFSDTPAATGTGKHRVRIGNSRFPEKRLQQAQLFNPDIRMVTSVAVAVRKDALCRAQEELKSMSLRGKRGWYWGSLEVILKVITDLAINKEVDIE